MEHVQCKANVLKVTLNRAYERKRAAGITESYDASCVAQDANASDPTGGLSIPRTNCTQRPFTILGDSRPAHACMRRS